MAAARFRQPGRAGARGEGAAPRAGAEQRLHHAYLFTGTRGVGKTTLARILAKCLNCETGITPEPCGKCGACTEIDGGRFPDLIEIDAATNTGIDEMRALQDNAAYVPVRGRFKVFVIDEVHMLSKPAFNSMLKTLEEPPAHIKFILATTDPQKIPVTVLSRCLQFNLKQMPRAAIVAHLEKVLAEEKVAFEREALPLIARAAAGSMRDALSLLDQAIAHGGGKLAAAGVREMLGAVDETYLLRLLEALAGGDGPALAAIADEMQARSLSFDAALQDLASLLLRVTLAQTVPAALEEDLPERERIVALAKAHRSGNGAAVLPDRAAGARRPAARAGRARGIPDDAAENAGFSSRANCRIRKEKETKQKRASQRRIRWQLGRRWCRSCRCRAAPKELARNSRAQEPAPTASSSWWCRKRWRISPGDSYREKLQAALAAHLGSAGEGAA